MPNKGYVNKFSNEFNDSDIGTTDKNQTLQSLRENFRKHCKSTTMWHSKQYNKIISM